MKTVTCGYLMAQPSTATVNHDTHLARKLHPHLLGCILIKYFVHHLNLCIVVTCPQSAQLQQHTAVYSQSSS